MTWIRKEKYWPIDDEAEPHQNSFQNEILFELRAIRSRNVQFGNAMMEEGTYLLAS